MRHRSALLFLLFPGILLALVAALPAAQAQRGRSARRVDPRAPRPSSSADLFALRIRPLLATNCFKCHGDLPRMAGLDLRSRASMLKGGLYGPALVPGKAEASRLYRRLAGLETPRMPPTGPLPAADLAAVRAWIDGGARWSSDWWAIRPVRAPAVPGSGDPWIRTPIDAFVLAKLRAAGLRPAPAASKEVLIRRATFDLTGLPPAPADIDTFLADRSPRAYEKLIDRLLASPRYGERWARRWLDLARYAESEGFKSDETRPNAWRYRDYVIRSFNEDKPYDRFVKEQIAGDELYPGDSEALVATGFNRHWADESNARNLRLRRQEILNDVTDTTGSVFLGLTVGCARCHDHKYDPISQKDYYRLQAFFAAMRPRDDLPLLPPEQLAEHRRRMAGWEEKTRDLRAAMAALETPYRDRISKDHKEKFPPDVLEALDTDPQRRTALQWQLALKAEPQLAVATAEVVKAMKPEVRQRWEAFKKQLDAFAPLKPPPVPQAIGITDVGREAPPTFVLATGVYDAPQEAVQPGFPAAIDARAPPIATPAGQESTGRRAALANWLASPHNPLTPRVIVNRVWEYHFGRGIVPTESDFGSAGEPPTHPELLDWLASALVAPDGERESAKVRKREKKMRNSVSRGDRGPSNLEKALRPNSNSSRSIRVLRSFALSRSPSQIPTLNIALGWRLKALHRLIMLSSTYRQASIASTAVLRGDPENRLFSRMPRQRLEGEAIRDAMLAVSGRLNLKMGGPSVFPQLPKGLGTRGSWPVTPDPKERDRRSIYVFVRRNLRYPLFQTFDMPDTHEPCARRSNTTTAPQSLMLLNDDVVLELARSFAGRLLAQTTDDGPQTTDKGPRSSGSSVVRRPWCVVHGPSSPEALVARAYRLAYGRLPSAEERELAQVFLERQAAIIAERDARGEALALPDPPARGIDRAGAAALVDFCHALFNTNEFLYVD